MLKNVEDDFGQLRVVKVLQPGLALLLLTLPSLQGPQCFQNVWNMAWGPWLQMKLALTCMNQLDNARHPWLKSFHIYSLLVERLAAGFPWPRNFAKASENYIGNSFWECWRRGEGLDTWNNMCSPQTGVFQKVVHFKVLLLSFISLVVFPQEIGMHT